LCFEHEAHVTFKNLARRLPIIQPVCDCEHYVVVALGFERLACEEISDDQGEKEKGGLENSGAKS